MPALTPRDALALSNSTRRLVQVLDDLRAKDPKRRHVAVTRAALCSALGFSLVHTKRYIRTARREGVLTFHGGEGTGGRGHKAKYVLTPMGREVAELLRTPKGSVA